MPNPVVHFEILGRDGKRAQDFYASLFGWAVDANNPMQYGMVAAQGSGIGGGVAAAVDQPRVSIYVEVPNLEEALRKAESLGGRTIMPPEAVPGGPTLAQFTDPDGNLVGLILVGSMPG
jgi:hypothetical protein